MQTYASEWRMVVRVLACVRRAFRSDLGTPHLTDDGLQQLEAPLQLFELGDAHDAGALWWCLALLHRADDLGWGRWLRYWWR